MTEPDHNPQRPWSGAPDPSVAGQPYTNPGYPPQGYGQPYGGPPGWAPQPFGPGSGAPTTLDQPHYGIGFVAAVQRAFRKYARFDGRASRSEYWWFALATSLFLLLGAGLVGLVLSATGGTSEDPGPLALLLTLVLFVALLAMVVPSISVTVRRLHDADFSGWLYLLQLIPYVGGLVMIIFTVQASKPTGARFDRAQEVPPYYG